MIFRFSQQLGMIVLTGTTNTDHMQMDLNIYEFELSDEEMATIEGLGV